MWTWWARSRRTPFCWARSPPDEDILLVVYAYCRNDVEAILDAQPIDLTDRVYGRYVYWDIPNGLYRVFSLWKTRRGGQQEYIHMIDPESVHVLIEAVYEPHYAHYSRYFGNTIARFFSDEPSLGNTRQPRFSMYDQKLGQLGLALPWSDELLRRLNEELGTGARGLPAGLWYPQGNGMPQVRAAYMDVLTRMWREAFSMQLGSWCRAHSVEYIGHIIEDMNAHMRLRCSADHYFRALDGQDMAGIDVVLHQIMPGMANYKHSIPCSGGYTDPEFFNYVLARLATSHSHIQPRMQNCVMCEIFGAYGWAEGVPMMKNLLDHMLVRGINRFVPHAFSPKYPDPDCPPHFNAGGENPQFSAFARLIHHANQVTHLLSGGTEIVSATIYYNAAAEWSGRRYMLMQKPTKMLYDEQLNYDFLPMNALIGQARMENGLLCVKKMRYPALIMPYSAWLPAPLLKKLEQLYAQGPRLAFGNGRPGHCLCGDVIPLSGVANYVRSNGGADLQLETPFPLLRACHMRHGLEDIFLLANESMQESFAGDVLLPVRGCAISAKYHVFRLRAGGPPCAAPWPGSVHSAALRAGSCVKSARQALPEERAGAVRPLEALSAPRRRAGVFAARRAGYALQYHRSAGRSGFFRRHAL